MSPFVHFLICLKTFLKICHTTKKHKVQLALQLKIALLLFTYKFAVHGGAFLFAFLHSPLVQDTANIEAYRPMEQNTNSAP